MLKYLMKTPLKLLCRKSLRFCLLFSYGNALRQENNYLKPAGLVEACRHYDTLAATLTRLFRVSTDIHNTYIYIQSIQNIPYS